MRRFLSGAVAAILASACAAASPQEGSVQFGRLGEENVRFDEICRSSTEQLPPAFEVFLFQLEEGGRTCFADGKGVLYVPKRRDRCPELAWPGFSDTTVLAGQTAEIELRRCLAFILPSRGPTGVLLYRPAAGGAVDFTQFSLDLGALVAHDMLPVTHFGAANGVVCMEAPDPRLVAERVVAADIADSRELEVEIARGSCRDLTYERTGHRWPEVVAEGG